MVSSVQEISKREGEMILFRREAHFLPATYLADTSDNLTQSFLDDYMSKLKDADKRRGGHLRILESRIIFKYQKHKKRLLDLKLDLIRDFFVVNKTCLVILSNPTEVGQVKCDRIVFMDPESAGDCYEKLWIFTNRSVSNFDQIRDRFDKDRMFFVRNYDMHTCSKFPDNVPEEVQNSISRMSLEEIFVNFQENAVEIFNLNEKKATTLSFGDIERVHNGLKALDEGNHVNSVLLEIQDKGKISHYCLMTPNSEETRDCLMDALMRNGVQIQNHRSKTYLKLKDSDAKKMESKVAEAKKAAQMAVEGNVDKQSLPVESVAVENCESLPEVEKRDFVISKTELMSFRQGQLDSPWFNSSTKRIITSVRKFNDDRGREWQDKIAIINDDSISADFKGNVLMYVAHKEIS